MDYHAAETAILADHGHERDQQVPGQGGLLQVRLRPGRHRHRQLPVPRPGVLHPARRDWRTSGTCSATAPRTGTYAPWARRTSRPGTPPAWIFQARNTDGSWAPANAGLFEGTTANYAFDEPQDGLGLAGIYGDSAMSCQDRRHLRRTGHLVQRLPADPAVPRHLGGQPGACRRTSSANYFLPEFSSLSMWEEPARRRLAVLHRQRQRGGSRQPRHLPDSVAGCAVDPQQPGGDQRRDPRAAGIRSSRPRAIRRHPVRLVHPGRTARPIPATSSPVRHSPARDTTLTFAHDGRPVAHRPDVRHRDRRRGLSAGTDNRTYLRFRNDPLGGTSQAKVDAAKAPAAVSVNGAPLPGSDWSYDSGEPGPHAEEPPRRARSWCGSAGTDRLPRVGSEESRSLSRTDAW